MSVDNLSQYSGIPADTIEHWLSLPPAAIYEDSDYLSWVTSLNEQILSATLPEVRAIYDSSLAEIKERYHLSDTIMSAHTLGNWVLGFLKFPDRMRDMLDRHTSVSPSMVASALPEMAALLDAMNDDGGRAEWQRALVLFSIPITIS